MMPNTATAGAEAPRTTPLKPKPRRRWLIGVAAIGLGCWLVMFVLWLQAPRAQPAEPPPVPSPNGYDDLLEAYKLLQPLMPVEKGQFPEYAKFETPALKAFVETIREPLDRIRVGLDRPFQVPYVYDLTIFMNTTLRDVGQVKAYVNRALQVEGLLARREKRTADAARSALDLIRMSNALGRDVPMVTYMSSLPSLHLGVEAIRDMRAELAMEPDLCRKVIAEMARLDRDRPTADQALRREMDFMDINVKKFGIIAAASIRVSGTLAKEKARAAETLQESMSRPEAFRRLVLADLAVKLYRRQNGDKPPASLEALVPSILPAVPVDPYGDKPLVYRAAKDGYELYSLGPDRDDDKLSPVLPKRFGKDANGDATLESF